MLLLQFWWHVNLAKISVRLDSVFSIEIFLLATQLSDLPQTKIGKGLLPVRQWGLCALRHGIQISIEAILACHRARLTE